MIWFVRRENGKAKDWIPFYTRPNCDRSYFDTTTGKDEGLKDAMERYAKSGYFPEKESPWVDGLSLAKCASQDRCHHSSQRSRSETDLVASKIERVR